MAGLMSGYGLCQEKMVYIHIREAPLLRSALLFRAGPQLGRLSRFFIIYLLIFLVLILEKVSWTGCPADGGIWRLYLPALLEGGLF